MLVELKIENFGIIEGISMRPGVGLSVITGETGSGKSLILQALDAVLGSRIGSGVVRNGASRAVVEAIFDISRSSAIREWLEKNGFPHEDIYLSLRREIAQDGKGRPFINGIPATLSLLRSLSSRLIELHGQHENQRLLDPETHLDSLDIYGGLLPDRERVAGLYHRYAAIKKRLRAVTLESGERDRRLDFLRFALEEIESFEPAENEFEELSHEKAIIQNSGRFFRDFASAYSLLREEEGSVLDRLASVDSMLDSHAGLHPGLDGQLGDLRESIYRLEALADYLRSEKEGMQFSPERLEDLEERLTGYRRLHKKYGGNTASVLKMRDEFLREISSIEMSDEEAELLRSEMEVVYTELRELAEELSRRRRSLIPLLEEKIAEELAALGMSGARIKISVKREIDPEVNPGSGRVPEGMEERIGAGSTSDARVRYAINERGLDRVEFMLCANAGENTQPLRKVASGGEVSRIMLALKSIIIEQMPVSTVIFDEVDAGVGGEVAHSIATRLKKISSQSQVLVVTHLHQLASQGDSHFKIQKKVQEGRTFVLMQQLHGERRLKELARMLGGESPGPVVLEHARELLARRSA